MKLSSPSHACAAGLTDGAGIGTMGVPIVPRTGERGGEMRSKRVRALLVAALSVGVVAAGAPGAEAGVRDRGGALRIARMTGAQEVPDPGDPDGSGLAAVAVFPARGELCFAMRVEDITLPAAAAHVHRGRAGVAGPVRVTLEAPGANGTSRGCVEDLRTRLLRRIKEEPRRFYVNVHTSDFPDGAVRGQLRRP
jgi:hypothetical protein